MRQRPGWVELQRYLADDVVERADDVLNVSILGVEHEQAKHLAQLVFDRRTILFQLLSVHRVRSEPSKRRRRHSN